MSQTTSPLIRDRDLRTALPGAASTPRRFATRTRRRTIDVGLASVFSAFLVLQMARHAMWGDELNAWGIVLASRTLPDLFHHLHYEGHPGLWHLLLWGAARVTTSPLALQTVQGAVAVGIIGMIALVSPFDRGEKILLLLGYFILFEYMVISRNYGIGVLLALIYAEVRARHAARLVPQAILLGLLANTNIFAMILSGALALERMVALGRERGSLIRFLTRPVIGAGALYAILLGTSVASVWPAADISWRTTGQPLGRDLSLDRVVDMAANNLSAVLPFDAQAFWSTTDSVDPRTYVWERILILAAVPFLVVAYRRIFANRPGLLVVPLLTFGGATTFNLLVYEGSVRHWGINFVAFLVALWIARAAGGPRSLWSAPILGLNAVVGVVFTVQHWFVPFSNAGTMAAWLTDHGYGQAVLAGTPDTHVVAVAELMRRPIYFLDCACADTYMAYTRRRDDFRPDAIPARLAAVPVPAAGQPIIFLNGSPLSDAQRDEAAARGLRVETLGSLDGALTENFHIYKVDRPIEPAAAR